MYCAYWLNSISLYQYTHPQCVEFVNSFDNIVHFVQFWLHQGALWSSQMPNVIQAQIMQDHDLPVSTAR